MSEIIPFPAARRVGVIRRLARLLASYCPEAAERTLHTRLDATRSAMLRRGIPPTVVDREIRSLELAIRVELWGLIMRGGAPNKA